MTVKEPGVQDPILESDEETKDFGKYIVQAFSSTPRPMEGPPGPIRVLNIGVVPVRNSDGTTDIKYVDEEDSRKFGEILGRVFNIPSLIP